MQIIKLSGAVQRLPREVVENVHGVAPRFLELPPGMPCQSFHLVSCTNMQSVAVTLGPLCTDLLTSQPQLHMPHLDSVHML